MTALADVLRAGRSELNARFAQAHRRMPALDGAQFGAFLVEAVGPLVEAVAAVAPDRAADVAHAAYDAALELCGQRLVGPGARDARIGAAWAALLAGAARLIAEDPARALAATANAIAQLAGTPGTRPEEWSAAMARLASPGGVPDVATWLAAGQVLAWRAGLAHYRAGALAIADRLAPELALSLLRAPAGLAWPELHAQLRADPWWTAHPAAPAPRVVSAVGAFRGLGGLFPSPPTVTGGADRFLVESGGASWVLFADAAGATFHRASDADRQEASAAGATPGLRVKHGVLEIGGQKLELPVRGEVTSTARAAATLAVTSSLTHAILLVALPPS